MKRLVLMTALLLVTLTLAAQNKQIKKSQTATYSVSMSCKKCQTKIEKNIPFEKGVKDMEVNLEKKQVSVTFDPTKTDSTTIAKALKNLDFDVK